MSRPWPRWEFSPADADLANEATRLTNRLHDVLLHVHPALERLLGQHLRRRGVLELLSAAGTPQQLRALGETALRQALAPRSAPARRTSRS